MRGAAAVRHPMRKEHVGREGESIRLTNNPEKRDRKQICKVKRMSSVILRQEKKSPKVVKNDS